MALGTQAQAITQLGLMVDASSSISSSEFATFRTGVANAVGQLNTDSSVELTGVQFAGVAINIVSPTVLDSVATRNTAVGLINAMVQTISGTNYQDAFEVTTALVTGSASFNDPEAIQIFNMLTDGSPSRDNTPNQSSSVSAVIARNAAIAAGIDVISFEAIDIGVNDSAFLFLLNELAFPQPAVISPPFPSPITTAGFVTPIANFDDVEEALLAKFEAANIVIPEPVTATLGMMGLSALMLATRRRHA